MYIERQLEKKFIAINEEYACVLLTGPRQVGKSTMLRHLMEGTARAEVSLDDLEERRLAKTDPAMFLKLHPAPVLIDEVQYAPELFSYIKIAVDNGAAPGSYWLTVALHNQVDLVAVLVPVIMQQTILGTVAVGLDDFRHNIVF